MLPTLGPFTDKSLLALGRLPVCDIELEHPSVSRYHAAIQFTRVNEVVEAQLFDLGSSHGTFLNKVSFTDRNVEHANSKTQSGKETDPAGGVHAAL